MHAVVICRELEFHLHLDSFSKLSDVGFLSSKFYKNFPPRGLKARAHLVVFFILMD